MSPHVVIVGSGPIGATYARLLLETLQDARVTMVEAGPQITQRPGASVRNIAAPDARAEARMRSQGPQAGRHCEELGIPAGTVVEGSFTARQGTHLVDFGGPGSGHAPTFPAAAVATNVGGQGSHWTCAVPRPGFSEVIPFIPPQEWEELIGRAEELLNATTTAFASSPVGAAIRALLAEEFAADLPDGYGPGLLPVAGTENPDGTMTWTGTDVVFGSLIEPGSSTAQRFVLRDLTLAVRVEHIGGVATGVRVRDLRTGQEETLAADAVVVAADALRSPQLLWASAIRPPALGHYLTEHPVVISTVALDAAAMSRFATDADLDAELARRARNATDPVSAVNRIPFSEPDHPFAAQIMYSETTPFPLDPAHPHAGNRWGYVNMGYGLRKRPRYEDAVTFDDAEPDYRDLPTMTITYALTDAELAEVETATALLRRAGAALGAFVAEPRLMPNGSSLHYQGTMRMGETDDGSCVADPWSRVWGYANLVVGGNGLIPTATAVNPTLTSVALAIRGARRLATQLAATDAATDAATPAPA
jgi:pyranose oxidase